MNKRSRKIKQSPELSKFYKELQKWIDGGMPNCEIFSIHYGLCSCAGKYDYINRTYVEREMISQFEKAGLNKNLPFDNSMIDYRKSVRMQNPKRLAWIKAHAA